MITHWFSELGESEDDVWVRETIVVLCRKFRGVMDRDGENAEGLGVLLDAVSGDHLSL